MTQFIMSGVKTDVTVQVLAEKKFGFVLRFFDDFEGGELSPEEHEIDGAISQNSDGYWMLSEHSKVHLTDEDIQSLGAAIEMDYLMD
ncbi:hypothetical protein WG906_16710 [Pedobacter sp. P351]|uniref:hypothetical protein n=1 Tax=Pedobacter superstes TaxID=3133441 RepID=UPI0030AE6309